MFSAHADLNYGGKAVCKNVGSPTEARIESAAGLGFVAFVVILGGVIRRFSSRQQKLGHSFLADRLSNATSYDRIAGYFSSSILEIAGEQIETMSGTVRIVCNSELDADDIQSARAANAAIRQEWCASDPISEIERRGKDRFVRLSEFLRSGKMVVKVLPSYRFGLIHGKAGVITRSDGTKTSFMGSANDHRNAWTLNYELIWEDDSDDAVKWVQAEFNALDRKSVV